MSSQPAESSAPPTPSEQVLARIRTTPGIDTRTLMARTKLQPADVHAALEQLGEAGSIHLKGRGWHATPHGDRRRTEATRLMILGAVRARPRGLSTYELDVLATDARECRQFVRHQATTLVDRNELDWDGHLYRLTDSSPLAARVK